MRIILFLLLFPVWLFAQSEFEKNDSLTFESRKYPTYFFKVGNDSSSNPVMVFIVDSRDFAWIKKRIPKIFFSRKQEYTDYYLLGINNLSKNANQKLITTQFLNQIDDFRMAKNLSTFLKSSNYDKGSSTFTYGSTFKDLDKVDGDLYYLLKKEDICKYMSCRN